MGRVGVSSIAAQLDERGIVFQVFGFATVGCVLVVTMQFCQGQSCITCGVVRDAAKVHWAFLGLMAWIFDKVRMMFEKRSELIQAEVERKLGAAFEKLDYDAMYEALIKANSEKEHQKQVMRKLGKKLHDLARSA